MAGSAADRIDDGEGAIMEKGLYSPAAAMTAAGSLLGSCAGLLAARRLCATITHKRAGEGGPPPRLGGRERAPYLH